MALENWTVSDVQNSVFDGSTHCDQLRGMGATVRYLNAFEMALESQFREPSLIIMSHPCLPIDWKQYFNHLQRHYKLSQTRSLYGSVLLESLMAQSSSSSIVMLHRRVDSFLLSGTSTKSIGRAPLREVPGWRPHACNHDVSAPLYPLHGGESCRAVFTLSGPLKHVLASQMVAGEIDLLQLCLDATVDSVPVVFLGL